MQKQPLDVPRIFIYQRGCEITINSRLYGPGVLREAGPWRGLAVAGYAGVRLDGDQDVLYAFQRANAQVALVANRQQQDCRLYLRNLHRRAWISLSWQRAANTRRSGALVDFDCRHNIFERDT